MSDKYVSQALNLASQLRTVIYYAFFVYAVSLVPFIYILRSHFNVLLNLVAFPTVRISIISWHALLPSGNKYNSYDIYVAIHLPCIRIAFWTNSLVFSCVFTVTFPPRLSDLVVRETIFPIWKSFDWTSTNTVSPTTSELHFGILSM